MSKLENLAQAILRELLAEFASQQRSADDLRHDYVGPSIPELKAKLCGPNEANDVDFELALNDLTKSEFIGTGPMAPFENDPNSSVLVLMFFSKNEYAYLKEKGYRAAQKQPMPKTPRANTLNISGGTFHNSSIGLAEKLTQSVSVSVSTAPVFADLRNAVLSGGLESESQAKLLAQISAMENSQKSEGFIKHYQDFITSAANHMTLIGPFIPALTSLLSGH